MSKESMKTTIAILQDEVHKARCKLGGLMSAKHAEVQRNLMIKYEKRYSQLQARIDKHNEEIRKLRLQRQEIDKLIENIANAAITPLEEKRQQLFTLHGDIPRIVLLSQKDNDQLAEVFNRINEILG